jgi:hypothetical protein
MPMPHWLKVVWRVLVWLGFNLGAQAIPVAYLWFHRQNGAFGEYVNCTLAILIAVSMLLAVMSDMATEEWRGRGSVWGWLTVIAILALAFFFLQRVIFDELLEKHASKPELVWGSLGFSLVVIGVGTVNKARIWDETVK